MKNIDWKLCLIADPDLVNEDKLIPKVEEAVEAGVTLVQLRVKSLSTRKFLELAIPLSALLRKKNIPFLVNDRVDIALVSQASGVHLGQDDLPLPYARKILGPDKIIGISVHNLEEALTAEKKGADYLGAGPVFPTSSKKDLSPLLGLEGIRLIREKTHLPILAIGGIKPENASAVIAAGADGVAAISAFFQKKDVRLVSGEFKQALSRQPD
ncbi:MAG: thiamine phosphate synthase [Acidobacteriota bacterium]